MASNERRNESINMPDALTVLTSLTASGALAGALLWITRNWLSERLKQSIQHEYGQKLEAHKAALKAANDVAIEQLKISTSALVEAKKIGHERILAAIQELWQGVLAIDENTPTIVSVMDVILYEEYDSIFSNPKLQGTLNKLTDETAYLRLNKYNQLEQHRPFFGEHLWYLFFGYRAVIGRMGFLIKRDRDTGSRVHWRQDDLIKQHLAALLTEQELADIYSSKLAPSQKMREYIKQKILHVSTQIISGQRSAADSLETAKQIAIAIAESTAENAR
ncbi:MAG: hypothetical protein ABL888_16140 [Pirellulaceae bacterium]